MRTSGSVGALVALGIVIGSASAANAVSFALNNDTPDGDGFVVVIAGGFNLFGSDSLLTTGDPLSQTATYTAIASANEILTFNWTYTTHDVNGSALDPAGYVINGVFTQLSTDNLLFTPDAINSSGVVTLTLSLGDTYGFYVTSGDNFGGRGEIDVTDAAAPVPGPIVGAGIPGLILLCGGLLGWAGKKRKDAALIRAA